MPVRRGAWYFLCLFNPVFLGLALNGALREQAQAEAQLALADWGQVFGSRAGRALLAVVGVIVVAVVALALYNRP